MKRYGSYLREDLGRYWRAYPEGVSAFWRIAMMLFQWELHAVVIYRLNFHLTRVRLPIGGKLLGYLAFVMQKLSEARSGVRLPASTLIGPGLFVMHTGSIGFHPLARIGANFTIAPDASMAGKIRGPQGQLGPTIGDNVFLGVGARIVGAINIGSDVIIGANAVVVTDIPDGATVVGNPGRVICVYGQPWTEGRDQC